MPEKTRLRRIGAFAGRALSAAAVALCAGALVAWGAWRYAPVLDSRWQLAFAVTAFAASAALLALLARAMWRAGAAGRSQRREKQGAVLLEFALILPIALMVVLIMVQASLLMVGNLCVHYAAFCAARSASVVVPQHLPPMEPRNVVAGSDSYKYRRIKAAALYAVLPVSCGGGQVADQPIVLQDGLEEYFARTNGATPAWVRSQIGRKWRYASENTEVDLAGPAGGYQYGPAEDLRVIVRHVFYLSVPYARRVFSLGNDGVRLSLGADEWGTRITASCKLTNDGVRDYVDIEEFSEEATGGE